MKCLVSIFLVLFILLSAFPAFADSSFDMVEKGDSYVLVQDYDHATACYRLAQMLDPANADAYLKIMHPDTGKEFTTSSLKKVLNEKYCDIYHQKIYELSCFENYERQTVDSFFRQIVKDLLEIKNPQVGDAFASLPDHFLDEPITDETHNEQKDKNVFIDPIRGRRIVFDTIHGVKGETHDATLYLETDRQGASDLNRILPYFGVGRVGKSNLFDYSRKLAYVGFSRPRTLLCVAMQSETYEKSKGVFDKDWDIIDMRN